MSRVLRQFKKREFKDYIIAGIANHKDGIEMHQEMGLKVIWEEEVESESHPIRAYVEGNYDMYLFGKMK